MVVDGDGARCVLGDDPERPAQPFVDDRTREGYDAVVNLNADAGARRPVELVELCLDGGLDLGVRMWAGRPRRRGQQSLEQIGARNHPNEGFPAQHRQALDAAADHPVHSLAELRVFPNRLDVAGHDFADLAAVLMGVSFGASPAAEQKFKPAWSLVLSSELAAAKKVAFAQNAAQSMTGVEDEQSAHPRTQHRLDGLGDARALGHADYAIGHYVANLHVSVLAWV